MSSLTAKRFDPIDMKESSPFRLIVVVALLAALVLLGLWAWQATASWTSRYFVEERVRAAAGSLLSELPRPLSEPTACLAEPPSAGRTYNTSRPTVAPDEATGQWELYEITLTSSESYGNPFRDVDVFADVTAPGGRTLRVYGFYDGNGNGGQGNLWKIRLMPDHLGTWSWETSATDTGNTGLHGESGAFEVVASGAPGPVSPDTTYPNAWRFANGDYFLWDLGYSIHMPAADRQHPGVGGWQDYLDWLEAHGFGGASFLLQSPSFSACTTCAKGMAPWSAIGNNPPPTYAVNKNGEVDYFVGPWARQGDPNDYARAAADADYDRFYLPLWQNVDAILAEMQAKGMIAQVWQYDDQTFHPAPNSDDERLYWDYIIRRLGAYWNVTFNDGIDLFEYRSTGWVDDWQQYFCDNMPFYHAISSRHGNDNGPLAVYRSMQIPSPANVAEWRDLMLDEPRKPLTEDDGIRALKNNGIPPERFMQLAWWSVLSGPGAIGAAWAGAHEPANWYANLDTQSEGMERVAHRRRFVTEFDPGTGKQIPFWRLQPADELVTGNRVYAAAVPGLHYLVYFDLNSAGSTELDLTATSQPLPVTWLNPVTGEAVSAGMSAPGTVQTFSKPFGDAAVLYVGAGEGPGNPPPPPPPVYGCLDAARDCHYIPMMQLSER